MNVKKKHEPLGTALYCNLYRAFYRYTDWIDGSKHSVCSNNWMHIAHTITSEKKILTSDSNGIVGTTWFRYDVSILFNLRGYLIIDWFHLMKIICGESVSNWGWGVESGKKWVNLVCNVYENGPISRSCLCHAPYSRRLHLEAVMRDASIERSKIVWALLKIEEGVGTISEEQKKKNDWCNSLDSKPSLNWNRNGSMYAAILFRSLHSKLSQIVILVEEILENMRT